MNDREVMQQIMQVLGPEAVCECSGCSWETNEAIRLLKEVGVEYLPRVDMIKPEHFPEFERLGDATKEVLIAGSLKYDRLLALARHGARIAHNWYFDRAENIDDVPPNGHVQPFNLCPHDDCRLVRDEDLLTKKSEVL